MEILRDYESTVEFVVPESVTNATYKVSRNGIRIGQVGNVTPENGVARVAVPYEAVQSDGSVLIELNFTHGVSQYARSTTVEVVTPYLRLHEVQKITESTDRDELIATEAAVRHIINAHVGQDFGLHKDRTFLVRGSGGSGLLLPKRLLELKSTEGVSLDNITLSNDGWILNSLPWGVPPVKADNRGYHMHQGGVIHNPNMVKLGNFTDGYEYSVTGDWGWHEVPVAVKEAAKLLVNDYACGDSIYRDRYLSMISSADWRMQFNSGAYAQTGNVRADQLLAHYVMRRGWAVI